MIHAITSARARELDISHRLSHETATWDDLEGVGTQHESICAAGEHLAAHGGGWLWFANDDADSRELGALITSYVALDPHNVNNWPREPHEPDTYAGVDWAEV